MFVTKGRLAVALLVIGVLAVVFGMYGAFTEPAEAGADEYVRVTNHIRYYDVGGAYCANLSRTVVSYEPVVYNGYGHYYNYHIMGNSGHPNGHGSRVTGAVTIWPTIQIDSCHT